MALASLWWKSLLWSAVLRCSFATFARAFSQFFEPCGYCGHTVFWTDSAGTGAGVLHGPDPSWVGNSKRLFCISEHPEHLEPEINRNDLVCMDDRREYRTVDHRFHLQGYPVSAVCPGHSGRFYGYPQRLQVSKCLPFGSTNRTLPIFGSFRYGSPSIIFNSMLLFV